MKSKLFCSLVSRAAFFQRKFGSFLLLSRCVTRGARGNNAPGAEKSQQYRMYFLQYNTVDSLPKDLNAWTWGRQIRRLLRAPPNLGTALRLHWIQLLSTRSKSGFPLHQMTSTVLKPRTSKELPTLRVSVASLLAVAFCAELLACRGRCLFIVRFSVSSTIFLLLPYPRRSIVVCDL